MSQTLAQRIEQADVADLPDWQAAAVLNAPDPSLPLVTEWRTMEIGPGSILDALGPADGAALLDALSSASDPVLRWGIRILEAGKLDIARASTRAQIDALVSAGVMTAAQREALLDLARMTRHPSWAEANHTVVDARAVGLARGGVA